MADTTSDLPSATRPIGAPTRATSKMALLLAFAAGAAFSWILMEVTNQESDAVQTTVQR